MNKINQFLLCALLLGMVTLTTFGIVGAIDERSNRSYNPETVVVNSVLQPYFNEYVLRLRGEGVKIPFGKDLVLVDFTNSFPAKYLGIAWGMKIDNVTVVQINGAGWRYLTVQQRRLLIWHELTHDVFNKYHGSSCIMNTPMPSRYTVTRQYVDRCVNELVKQLKKNQDDTK